MKGNDRCSIYNEDCMVGMSQIPAGSVDMILCDLPYGQTKNKWDEIIPFEALWKEYKRIAKPNAAIVLFSDGMFTANLMRSNPKMWRYNLTWDKVLTTGFLNANRMPLRQSETICVFYEKLPTYNPQKTVGAKSHSKGQKRQYKNRNYGEYNFIDNAETNGIMKYPTSIIRIPKIHSSKALHPTEKPVELCEYLIKTYTNHDDIVLDNCMGCGSTGVAAIKLDRRFIGFEKECGYFEIAKDRIMREVTCHGKTG